MKKQNQFNDENATMTAGVPTKEPAPKMPRKPRFVDPRYLAFCGDQEREFEAFIESQRKSRDDFKAQLEAEREQAKSAARLARLAAKLTPEEKEALRQQLAA
jgi:hypothetical protein